MGFIKRSFQQFKQVQIEANEVTSLKNRIKDLEDVCRMALDGIIHDRDPIRIIKELERVTGKQATNSHGQF